jgi:hypothetical protein
LLPQADAECGGPKHHAREVLSSTLLRNLFAETLWLGGAAAFAYFFLKTFLVIQGFALLITITLRLVERSLTRA